MNNKQVLISGLIASFVSSVAAGSWNAGDTIALLIGIAMFFVLLLAFLGWYSRRQ
ncbi:hypothetical protein PPL_04696 [Heterostelium album PN500]|uniref:Uncharacterized protein n=1 Tax=Heterostelium pallidum (strain ATCC 26659 / Pp 5 / PN500) TaxID=670386 RepID=D3B8A5_HETP5|nr:hypothetical protein PPL_04696 [Heterostelium album PN500]EFA82273.1 hypothetical protein PPL_04696 [Heterostelium album PN500]|eukprot:XP_020434390.1 hypothetical protein PPL_04696 [Heterostelium album PN500]